MHFITSHQSRARFLLGFLGLFAGPLVFAAPTVDRRGEMGPDLTLVDSLDSISSQMTAAQVLLTARYRLADDQQIFEIQKALHLQNEQVHEQHALSEEEFRRSLWQRDQAEAQVELSKANLREAATLVRIYSLRARFANGQKLQGQALANAYVDLWKARLDSAQSATARSQAEYAYRSFHLNMILKLQQQQAASRQELLESMQAEKSASYQLGLYQSKAVQTKCFWQEFAKNAEAPAPPDPRRMAPEKCLQLGG